MPANASQRNGSGGGVGALDGVGDGAAVRGVPYAAAMDLDRAAAAAAASEASSLGAGVAV